MLVFTIHRAAAKLCCCYTALWWLVLAGKGKIIIGVWGMENVSLYTSDLLFYYLLPISSVQISFDLSTVVCSGILIELPACIQCSCSNGDQVEFNTFRILQLENQN